MVDFIKIRLPAYYSVKMYSNYLLEFHQEVKDTGEVHKPYCETEFGPMKIKSASRYVEISGSLHKYYNWYTKGEMQNHSDFYRDQIEEALEHLSTELRFKLEDAELKNLEFGVNVMVPFEVRPLVKNKIILHKSYPAYRLDNHHSKGFFREYKYTDYFVKIYDKGQQYDICKNLVRFELKYMRSRIIRKNLGVSTLSDLTKRECLVRMQYRLCKSFGDLVITDWIDIDSDHPNSRILAQRLNPQWWDEYKLKVKKGNLKHPDQKIRREIIKLKELISEAGLDNSKKIVRQLIKEKCNQLIT